MESCVKVHSGTVTGVEKNGSLTVKLSQSQCDGCQLGKLCNVSSGNELILSVATDEAKDLSVGDKVNVEELQNLEHTAIWLCLVLPCVVFLTAVSAVSCIFTSLAGCIAGFIVLAIYYGVFYMLKGINKKNRIIFKVKKIK